MNFGMNRILLLLLISLYPFLSNAQLPMDTVFRMDQRHIVNAPDVTDTHNQAGKVVLQIHVDRKGNVTSAIVRARGTTISDTSLLRKCQNAVLKAKFSPAANVPEIQTGYMTFVFKLKAEGESDKKDTAGKDKRYR